jgi:hypothetical protein
MRVWELPQGMWMVVEQCGLNQVSLLSTHLTMEEAEAVRKNACRHKRCYCLFLKPCVNNHVSDNKPLEPYEPQLAAK